MSVDPTSSPLAYFAAELARARTRAGLSQAALARRVNFSTSQIAMVETCKRIPSPELARGCDEALGTDGMFARLQPLVARSSVLPWFRNLIEVEAQATEIRAYHSYLVPGLLQTEAYARASAAAERPALSPEDVERAVAVRMTRQEILDRDVPPRLWVILEEAVLHRFVGDVDVMRAQYAHLLRMSERPGVVIQVMPNTEGLTCAFGRTFILLDNVVYLEDLGSSRYVRERDEVSGYVLAFDHLRASALPEARSVAMIGEQMERLEWRTSTHSGGQGECVEVAALPDGRATVRDSKDPAGPRLTFARPAWRRLLTQLKGTP